MLTTRLMLRSKRDKEQMGASSVDYLLYSGYLMMGYFWALQAEKARQCLSRGDGQASEDFYRAKIHTAEFYFERLLPRANAHYASALASTQSLMQISQTQMGVV